MTSAVEILDAIGPEAMARLCDAFGGERVYIPKHVPDPKRTENIVRIFCTALKTGASCASSYERAGREYGLSARRTREIIAGI